MGAAQARGDRLRPCSAQRATVVLNHSLRPAQRRSGNIFGGELRRAAGRSRDACRLPGPGRALSPAGEQQHAPAPLGCRRHEQHHRSHRTRVPDTRTPRGAHFYARLAHRRCRRPAGAARGAGHLAHPGQPEQHQLLVPQSYTHEPRHLTLWLSCHYMAAVPRNRPGARRTTTWILILRPLPVSRARTPPAAVQQHLLLHPLDPRLRHLPAAAAPGLR